MAYTSGGRLPIEKASKLGHLSVIESEWVKSLIDAFEALPSTDGDPGNTIWTKFESEGVAPLTNVWAVDGSFVSVKTEEKPAREVAFIKAALVAVDKAKLDRIDKDHPHPLLLRDVLSDSAVFHCTALPLKNIKTSLGSNYDAVRNIVKDSIRSDQNGLFYETLKWIVYQQWNGSSTSSPAFACPHCGFEIDSGMPADADEMVCSNTECKEVVFLSDIIGFHLDMDEESAPDSVSSAYMAIVEHLMLFTAVRLMWNHSDKTILSNTLFIKDGPLTLRAQYSKLVPCIRAFLEFAKQKKRPVHIIGQEKSGAFFDHLSGIVRFTSPFHRGESPSYTVLNHGYVRKEVHRSPNKKNPYGLKTNWGEKMYLKFEPGCSLVLNVPTGSYQEDVEFPVAADLIGLERILATIPSIISHRFEGALFPVELANGVASLSSYPSAKILQRFIEKR